MKRIRRFASTIVDRRELASDIEGISKRISKVIHDMQSFGVQQIINDGSRSSHPLQERQREMRHTFSRDYENDFVGLEENVKKLVEYLVEKDDYQIVSLTGMGGLGKTTLARQVFNHDVIKDQFDGFAWVSVSQEFTRISVWQTILQNLTSKERKDEIQNMKEADLHDDLFRLLESSTSLIVLDDIWKEEDWDLIKPIFPPKKGWKVLLTSRTENIAMRGDTTYINFKPKCLSIPDSWKLFQSIAMPHLTILDLSYCCLEEDPMPILEKLLELKDLSLGYLAFSGRKIVCSAGGFPQLRKLDLDEQEEWEEWILEEGSMPLLNTLNIWSSKLKELPDGLRFIYSLKNLSIGKSWEERLSERGEEFYKVKHIPSIKFY